MVELKDLVSEPIEIDDKVIKFNGKEITVKQYLPYEDKLKAIANVFNLLTMNSNRNIEYLDPVQLDLYLTIELISQYTDIQLPEEESLSTIFDTLVRNNILDAIMTYIPRREVNFITDNVNRILEEHYKFKNSAKGIIQYFVSETDGMADKVQSLKEDLANAENLDLLKDIVNKLG